MPNIYNTTSLKDSSVFSPFWFTCSLYYVFFCDYKSLWGSKLPRHCSPQWRPPFLSRHKLLLNCSPQKKPLLSLFGGWPYKRIGGGLLYFIYKFIGLIIRFNFVFLCPRDKESGGILIYPCPSVRIQIHDLSGYLLLQFWSYSFNIL